MVSGNALWLEADVDQNLFDTLVGVHNRHHEKVGSFAGLQMLLKQSVISLILFIVIKLNLCIKCNFLK